MRNYIHNTEQRRFEFYDTRYYTADGETFFPSVTHILNDFPKGDWFEMWLKSVGMNADKIKMDAADIGSNVHNAIDKCLKGEQLNLVDNEGNPIYTKDEWKMIQRFGSFWRSVNPKLISTELNIISDNYKIGGTLDLVCDINGETWLIDHKTSNAIQDAHYIQLAVYATMWNYEFPDQQIDRCGILWLKSSVRGESLIGQPKEPSEKDDPPRKKDPARRKKDTDEDYQVRLNDQEAEYQQKLKDREVDFQQKHADWIIAHDKWTKERPMQGSGWQIKELTWKKNDDEVVNGLEAYAEYFKLYRAVRYIWDFNNKNFKPFNMTMSDHLKITV